MNFKKRYVILAIIVVCLFSGAAYFVFQNGFEGKKPCRDWPEIKASGVLNVVTEYNAIDYYVSGDSIAGIQYELCKQIEKRAGLKINLFLENDWETCVKKLAANTYDVIAMNIPVTSESKKHLAFTNPLTQSKLVLVQRSQTGRNDPLLIRNQLDLAYKKIFIPKNSPSLLRLRNLSEEIAEPISIEEIDGKTQEHLLYMVYYGQIDYTVVDEDIAAKYKDWFLELDMQTEIGFTHLRAWAVRKSSPVLLDSLNLWLPKQVVKRRNKSHIQFR
jgi:membrane-bound lytic murein transglycosylase MltF